MAKKLPTVVASSSVRCKGRGYMDGNRKNALRPILGPATEVEAVVDTREDGSRQVSCFYLGENGQCQVSDTREEITELICTHLRSTSLPEKA